METLKSLRDQVLHWLDEAGDTSTTKTNVDNAINQAHQMRLSQLAWPFMRWDQPVTLTMVSSQRFYSLHPEFNRPIYFKNTATNAYLVEVPARELVATGADWDTDTTGNYFRFGSRMPVAAQPTAASVLSITSTDAADTSAVKAIIVRGETPYGITTESIAPAGTGTVLGLTAFTKILNVTKVAPWAGRLTLATSGGDTLLSLYGAEMGRSYQQIELLNLPSTGSIEYLFFKNPSPLVNDYDIPDIPSPHSNVLVWDTLVLFAGYNTELRRQAVDVWMRMQQEQDTAMKQAFLEGQSLNARPRYVRYIDEGR